MKQYSIEPVVGYCTNVHAGTDLEKVQQNLQHYSLDVKGRVRPDSSMGIGLWLSHEACRDLLQQTELQHFADWIAEHQLLPFTFNGFPYSNFHQPIVKHQVYQPDWSRLERFEYTRHLAHIQRRLFGGSTRINAICHHLNAATGLARGPMVTKQTSNKNAPDN